MYIICVAPKIFCVSCVYHYKNVVHRSNCDIHLLLLFQRIFFLHSTTRERALASPYYEVFERKGIEVSLPFKLHLHTGMRQMSHELCRKLHLNCVVNCVVFEIKVVALGSQEDCAKFLCRFFFAVVAIGGWAFDRMSLVCVLVVDPKMGGAQVGPAWWPAKPDKK